ncbi:hypothetical protein BGX29_000673 [Mortierella sp. GBA35]|nr:hypothetical protein BGX29_000673 [Mortierella sp. GBA35]
MSTLLTRLRFGITALVVLVIILNGAYYAVYNNSEVPPKYKNVIIISSSTFYWSEIVIFVDHAFLLLTYIYASFDRFPTKVPRYGRAFMIFVLAVFLLYVNLNVLSRVFEYKEFSCGGAIFVDVCKIARVVQVFSTVLGFLILYEAALTLKETNPNPASTAEVQGAGGAVDPNYIHPTLQMQMPPMQQQNYPQQQFQGGGFYPQQQQPFVLGQQQSLQDATPKFEAQGQQQFQQQPFYQQPLHQQQQQQQQFYQQPLQQPGQQPLQQNPYGAQQQSAAQPMVPGSLVTTTPQPGGQAIAPYPTSGASVAVSPVLPVGGYSTPSPSVGHQSPVHPSQ